MRINRGIFMLIFKLKIGDLINQNIINKKNQI